MEPYRTISPVSDPHFQPLDEPHFDEEATQVAKRVVPLSGGSIPAVQVRRPSRAPVLTLAVVLIAAIAGLICGMVIAGRKSGNQPRANQQQPQTITPDTSVVISKAEEPAASASETRNVPPKTEQALVVTKNAGRVQPEASPEPAGRSKPAVETSNPSPRPPVVHEKNAGERDASESRDYNPDWITRREERRARRTQQRAEDNNEDFPGTVRRQKRQIDRIKDIFLGEP
jgi:cytoskeletal protein RodZ